MEGADARRAPVVVVLAVGDDTIELPGHQGVDREQVGVDREREVVEAGALGLQGPLVFRQGPGIGVEVLAGPIPPLSPARPPVVAPVSPGTTDAEVQDLVAKLRATLARRKDKAPSDDDVVRAVLAGRADAWPPPPRRTGEEFFDARS